MELQIRENGNLAQIRVVVTADTNMPTHPLLDAHGWVAGATGSLSQVRGAIDAVVVGLPRLKPLPLPLLHTVFSDGPHQNMMVVAGGGDVEQKEKSQQMRN